MAAAVLLVPVVCRPPPCLAPPDDIPAPAQLRTLVTFRVQLTLPVHRFFYPASFAVALLRSLRFARAQVRRKLPGSVRAPLLPLLLHRFARLDVVAPTTTVHTPHTRFTRLHAFVTSLHTIPPPLPGFTHTHTTRCRTGFLRTAVFQFYSLRYTARTRTHHTRCGYHMPHAPYARIPLPVHHTPTTVLTGVTALQLPVLPAPAGYVHDTPCSYCAAAVPALRWVRADATAFSARLRYLPRCGSTAARCLRSPLHRTPFCLRFSGYVAVTGSALLPLLRFAYSLLFVRVTLFLVAVRYVCALLPVQFVLYRTYPVATHLYFTARGLHHPHRCYHASNLLLRLPTPLRTHAHAL